MQPVFVWISSRVSRFPCNVSRRQRPKVIIDFNNHHGTGLLDVGYQVHQVPIERALQYNNVSVDRRTQRHNPRAFFGVLIQGVYLPLAFGPKAQINIVPLVPQRRRWPYQPVMTASAFIGGIDSYSHLDSVP